MVDQFISGNVDIEGDAYLVTGSHGHIGSYIVEELVKQKDNIIIICVDNLYNGSIINLKESFSIAADKNIRIIPVIADITDEKIMRDTFIKYKPIYVFHAASYLTLDSNKYKSRSIKVNVFAGSLLFELCLEFGVNRKLCIAPLPLFMVHLHLFLRQKIIHLMIVSFYMAPLK